MNNIKFVSASTQAKPLRGGSPDPPRMKRGCGLGHVTRAAGLETRRAKLRGYMRAAAAAIVLTCVAAGLAPAAEEAAVQPAPSSDLSLRERFLNPPARFRILKIIHNIPETPKGQDELLGSLAAQGFGGMVTNVPFTNYLQDEARWQAFVRIVNDAKKAGMAMWLYDEKGYPSGTAGGLTLKDHPEWEARGLLVADAVTSGGPVALDLPPGKLVRASAFPVSGGVIDLDKAVDLAGSVRDGKLAWTAPAGEWRIMAITEDRLYEGTHASVALADKQPYINLLDAAPTARFIELTHQAYAGRLGQDLGKYFIATFTDEPSLMSLFMRPRPYRPLPWSAGFAREFRSRRGYAIEPLLPALAANAGPKGARARYDFWLTVGELVSENFFGQIRDWGRKHNIPSGGHALLEEPILMHVPCYGDLFRCERMLDAPSLDCLTSQPPYVHWFSARLVSSAGELEGRADNMCETSDHAQRYRPKGDTRPVVPVSEEEIRGTCNRLIVNGITCITSYYSFASLSPEQLQRLNLWIGRSSAMLYGGRQVTDVAVVYPIESIWPRFEPAREWVKDSPQAAHQVQHIYMQTVEQLFAHRRDFTFIDSRTLVEADASGGAIRCRDFAWRVVVLPCVDTLPLAAWQNLAKFWRSGGAVVALGALPTNSEKEFPSPAVQAIAKEIFGDGSAERINSNAAGGAAVYLPAGSEAWLPKRLDAIIEPEVRVADDKSPIRLTHRRIGGQEIFFLINDSPAAWEGDVDLAAEGKGERYDPATGAITPLAGAGGIHLKFDPYGGVLFRFDKARLPVRRTASANAAGK